jgi:hypothetical protein
MATFIEDANQDTKVQTEKNANEDKIRLDTAGTERMVIDSSGVAISTDLKISKATPLFKGTHTTDNGSFELSRSGSSQNAETILSSQTLLTLPLSGWSYRKKITINGTTDGAQTNYQMKLIIHRASGTDSGGDVYLGTNGCQSDYDDIRFTKYDGTTLLDY